MHSSSSIVTGATQIGQTKQQVPAKLLMEIIQLSVAYVGVDPKIHNFIMYFSI